MTAASPQSSGKTREVPRPEAEAAHPQAPASMTPASSASQSPSRTLPPRPPPQASHTISSSRPLPQARQMPARPQTSIVGGLRIIRGRFVHCSCSLLFRHAVFRCRAYLYRGHRDRRHGALIAQGPFQPHRPDSHRRSGAAVVACLWRLRGKARPRGL